MNRKNKVIRLVINTALIAIIALLLYISLNNILPGFIEILAEGDEAELQEYLQSFRTFDGYLVGFLLQFIQIITIFLPSAPIQIATGFIFGTWKAFIVCYLGYVSANAVIFLAGRALDGGLEKLLPSNSNKSINSGKAQKILDSKYPAFTVFLASILPLIPNGVIPYTASKTKMKFSSFIISVAIGCIPTVYTVCAIGGELHTFDYLTAALMVLPLFALTGVLFWQKNNLISVYEKALKRLKKGTYEQSEGDDDEIGSENEKESAIAKEPKRIIKWNSESVEKDQ